MNWGNKNVLITGISGFVGSYIARYLLGQGASLYGFVRRRADGTRSKNLRDIEAHVKLIEGDLTDISSLAFALDESKPDIVFHLGSQSFVPRSFTHPLETLEVNTIGTANLLEAVRLKDLDPIIVFAGSSEEYGLALSSEKQYEIVKKKYGTIYPEPEEIPELPINEKNPLRPMSPYAVSKIQGDYLMRNYYCSYGMKTIVSRGFNQEGAGRGIMFVTSVRRSARVCGISEKSGRRGALTRVLCCFTVFVRIRTLLPKPISQRFEPCIKPFRFLSDTLITQWVSMWQCFPSLWARELSRSTSRSTRTPRTSATTRSQRTHLK
ncbi:GDP-mannose 4,6-dehydratase [subsurface metagenome]